MLGDDSLSVAILVYGLTLVLAFVGVAPVASFVLRPRAHAPVVGDPYRAPAASADLDLPRGRAVGVLVGVVGVVLVLAAPVVLVVGFLSSFTLAPSRSDATGVVFDLLAALGAFLIGPALIVSGRRVWLGTPTTRVNVAHALVLAFALLGASAFTIAYDPSERLVAAAVGIACVMIGKAIGIALLFTGVRPTQDAPVRLATRRIAGSSFLLGVLLAIAAGASWWLVGEIGDRMSVLRPSDDPSGLEALQTLTLWPAVTCSAGVLVGLVIAVLAFRASRAPLS